MLKKTLYSFWFNTAAELMFWGGFVWMNVDHFWPRPNTGAMPVWVILAGCVLKGPQVIRLTQKRPDVP